MNPTNQPKPVSELLASGEDEDKAAAERVFQELLASSARDAGEVYHALRSSERRELMESFDPKAVGRILGGFAYVAVAEHVNWLHVRRDMLQGLLPDNKESISVTKAGSYIPEKAPGILRNAQIRRLQDMVNRLEIELEQADDFLEGATVLTGDREDILRQAEKDRAIYAKELGRCKERLNSLKERQFGSGYIGPESFLKEFASITASSPMLDADSYLTELASAVATSSVPLGSRFYFMELAFENAEIKAQLSFVQDRLDECAAMEASCNPEKAWALVHRAVSMDLFYRLNQIASNAPDRDQRIRQIRDAFQPDLGELITALARAARGNGARSERVQCLLALESRQHAPAEPTAATRCEHCGELIPNHQTVEGCCEKCAISLASQRIARAKQDFRPRSSFGP